MVLRGWCRFNLDDISSAEGDFLEALRANRNFAEAHDGLGHVAWQQGNLMEAKKHFTNAIRNDAEDPEYLVSRGDVNLHLEKYADARRDFEAAIKIDPGFIDAQRGLAFAHIDMNEFDAGLAILDTIIESYKQDPEAFYYAGWALKNLNRMDEAVDVLQAVTRLDAEHVGTHNVLCEVLLELNRFEEALPSAIIARNAYPDDAKAACRHGLALVGTGSIAEVGRAKELAPDDADIGAAYEYLRNHAN